jgi:DNA-binding transcriptional ArsR family regulator
MTLDVSDFRANPNETILFAAGVVGKSKARRKVFREIYKSKRRFKTVSEIARATGLSKMRVLQEGLRLAGNHLVEKGKVDGQTAYRKDATLSHHKARILSIVANPQSAKKYPTKQQPHSTHMTSVTVRVQTSGAKPREITIDDVASFKLVRGVRSISGLRLAKMPEKDVKASLKRIIGEPYDYKDWGGERNDLYTNKFRVGSSRIAAAFALKGRATQGTLTPRKMGSNGDQIQRLFLSAADVFFVVYHSKIDESVLEQMRAFAVGKSMSGRRVYYGIIDGDDLTRLYQAYRTAFR